MVDTYRIMIVDDDEDTGNLLLDSIRFSNLNLDGELVKDGQAALDALRKNKFDAVILDLMLPKMTGEDVLRNLDSDPKFKGFPILVNSTKVGTSWNNELLQSFRNVRIKTLPRPMNAIELIGALMELMGSAAPAKKSGSVKTVKKVLIVDDDESIHGLYVPFFRQKGYDVCSASNGKEALDIMKNGQVYLVILDLNMPVMSGEEVLKVMSETDELKTITVLINTQASDRMEKVKSEFKNKLRLSFYQRPSSLVELSRAIGQILAL